MASHKKVDERTRLMKAGVFPIGTDLVVELQLMEYAVVVGQQFQWALQLEIRLQGMNGCTTDTHKSATSERVNLLG